MGAGRHNPIISAEPSTPFGPKQDSSPGTAACGRDAYAMLMVMRSAKTGVGSDLERLSSDEEGPRENSRPG